MCSDKTLKSWLEPLSIYISIFRPVSALFRFVNMERNSKQTLQNETDNILIDSTPFLTLNSTSNSNLKVVLSKRCYDLVYE